MTQPVPLELALAPPEPSQTVTATAALAAAGLAAAKALQAQIDASFAAGTVVHCPACGCAAAVLHEEVLDDAGKRTFGQHGNPVRRRATVCCWCSTRTDIALRYVQLPGAMARVLVVRRSPWPAEELGKRKRAFGEVSAAQLEEEARAAGCCP